MTGTPPLEREAAPVGDQSAHRERLPRSLSGTSSLPDVTPIMPTDRLAMRAAATLRSAKAQKPAGVFGLWGLFNLNARDRLLPVAKTGA